MKFILIATALNLQMAYPDENICNVALDAVKKHDAGAFCIPAGEDHIDSFVEKFQGLMIIHKKMIDMEKDNTQK